MPRRPSSNSGQVAVTNQQITVFGTALFLMVVLEWIVLKTKLGRAMRAVSHSHETASLVGIPTDTIISLHLHHRLGPGGRGGHPGGHLLSQRGPLDGRHDRHQSLRGGGLGGHRQHPGRGGGGFLMGISEAMVVGYGSSTYRDALAFAILILILLFKPAGLFGKYQPEKV